jgi:hypothetical protein
MIAMYNDDIPAACNDTAWLAFFKARHGARFKINDMCALSQLLGMHITGLLALSPWTTQSTYVTSWTNTA